MLRAAAGDVIPHPSPRHFPLTISRMFRHPARRLLLLTLAGCGTAEPKTADSVAAAAPVATAVRKDTAPPAPGTLRDGRSAMDQRSYAAAIKAGDASLAKWPAIESAPHCKMINSGL